MARYHERYGSEDHGVGDAARRHAEADYREQFGTGGRTQNLPDDYGTGRDPQRFDRRYPDEPYCPDYHHQCRISLHRRRAGRGTGHRARRRAARTGGAQHHGGYRGRGPKNYARSDERIQEDISERLWDADDVDASDVVVEVKNGEVTLRGNVERRSIKHRIEDIADGCGGVKDIHNEIRVQPRNEWPYDKGVAAGSTEEASLRSGRTDRNEGMVQSAIEEMPPRSH